jgi:DNA helicase-2/ATP-dependent DNA helicase PcrA
MTRAKDQLHLMIPQRFYTHGERGDRHVYAQRTRFIPDTLLKHFECCAWPPPHAARADKAATPKVDMRTRMRRMWD